jgi:hypothetical protein
MVFVNTAGGEHMTWRQIWRAQLRALRAADKACPKVHRAMADQGRKNVNDSANHCQKAAAAGQSNTDHGGKFSVDTTRGMEK